MHDNLNNKIRGKKQNLQKSRHINKKVPKPESAPMWVCNASVPITFVTIKPNHKRCLSYISCINCF